MRTTVTLEPEAESVAQRVMAESGMSFKELINTAVIRAYTPPTAKTFQTRSRPMKARVNLDKALAVAGELEDSELIRKREMGK